MQMMFATDAWCTTNALGTAFGSPLQSAVQQSLAGGLADGSFSMSFLPLATTDPTGAPRWT